MFSVLKVFVLFPCSSVPECFSSSLVLPDILITSILLQLYAECLSLICGRFYILFIMVRYFFNFVFWLLIFLLFFPHYLQRGPNTMDCLSTSKSKGSWVVVSYPCRSKAAGSCVWQSYIINCSSLLGHPATSENW